MKREQSGRRERRSRWLTRTLAGLALLGLVLCAEGALRGLPRHRLFALSLGLLACFPFVLHRLLGQRAERLLVGLGVLLSTGLLVSVAAEFAVRALDLPAFKAPERIDDPVLGHIFRPGWGRFDELGFRNDAVPERADVICIGDSLTFGFNVPREQAFPQALERLSGWTVYSMGHGGYGPIQYAALAGRGLSLEPRAIVIGFFFGNDLVDAHRFAVLDHWNQLRDPEVAYPETPDGEPLPISRSNLAMEGFDWLMHRSRFYWRLYYVAKLRLKQSEMLRAVYWSEPDAPSWASDSIATQFAPQYRLGLMRLGSPAVRDGVRITELCLGDLARQCAEEGVALRLLLLHTKEFYYARLADALESEGPVLGDSVLDMRSVLDPVAAAESRLEQRLRGMAMRKGLELLDPSARIVAALRAGRALYPPGVDGHFGPGGCALIAEFLRAELGELLP